MKPGFLTSCLPQVGLDPLLQWASAQGFQTMELAAWPQEKTRDYQAQQIDAARFTREDASRVNELFDQYDLEIAAMAFYENNIHPDKKIRDANVDHLKKVIDTASLLGVDRVGTFVGSNPEMSPTDNMKEIGRTFRELVKYATDKGVRLMIENCPMENWVKFGLPGNYAYSPEL